MAKISPYQVNDFLVRTLTQDLAVEYVGSTQVMIRANSVVGADDGSVVMTSGTDITVDITVSGANGLDTGVAADTWYYIYMIWNPDTEVTAGLLSVSSTSPVMPSGYTKKRLVGVVRRNGAFNMFVQVGQDVSTGRFLVYESNSTSFVTVDVNSVVPPIAKAIIFQQRYQLDGSKATSSAIIRAKSYPGVDRYCNANGLEAVPVVGDTAGSETEHYIVVPDKLIEVRITLNSGVGTLQRVYACGYRLVL